MQRERRSSLFLLFFWRLVPVVKEEEKERSLSALPPPPLPVSADEGRRFDGEFTQRFCPCFFQAFVGEFPSCSFVAAKFQCRRGFLLLLLLSLYFCANRPPKKLFFLLTSGIVDIQFWGLDDANIFPLVLCMSPACGFATDSPSSQQISSRPLFHEK